jgi:hypothetical protein
MTNGQTAIKRIKGDAKVVPVGINSSSLSTTVKKKKKTKKSKKVKIEETEIDSDAVDAVTAPSCEKKHKKRKKKDQEDEKKNKKKESMMATTTRKKKKTKKAQQNQADTPKSVLDVVAIAVPDPPAIDDSVEVDMLAAGDDDDDDDDDDTQQDIEQGFVGVERTTGLVNLVKKTKDDTLGFTYVKMQDGKTTMIETVTPGGLADHAGLEVGMKILTVNGECAYDVDLGDLDDGTVSFIIDRPCDHSNPPVAVAVREAQWHTQTHKPPVESNGNEVARCGTICPLITIVIGVVVMLFLSMFIGIVVIVIGISIWACIRRQSR